MILEQFGQTVPVQIPVFTIHRPDYISTHNLRIFSNHDGITETIKSVLSKTEIMRPREFLLNKSFEK